MTTATALAVLLASLASGSQVSLSVCEAARIGERLDGKTVRIKGVWREAFSGEGLFDELVDDECPEIAIRVVATDVSVGRPAPPGYKLDHRSIRRAQRVAEKALADGRNLSATIEGVLYVQKKEDYVPTRPLNNDVIIAPHHKWYPLVLLIQAVPDVRER